MIREFLIPELERQNVHNTYGFNRMEPPHIRQEKRWQIVKRLLPHRLISRFGDIPWPPRSPDLTPCNFSLWGYLKSRVYVTNPTNLQELRNNIYHEIAELSQDTLYNEGYGNDEEKSPNLSTQPWRSSKGYYIQNIVSI